MDDKLKEKAERGVLDNMLSTAQTALAIGAGAAFLYRSGGKNFLSEASSISSRVLGGVKEDVASISGRKLETSDLKSIYNKAFKGEDSYYQQGRAESKELGRFRRYDQSTNLGQMLQAVSTHAKISAESVSRPVFDYTKIIVPTASRYANQLGKSEEEKKKIGEFVEKTFKNLNNHNQILEERAKLKLQETVTGEDVQKIIADLKQKRIDTEQEFSHFAFKNRHVEKEAETELFGLEALKKQAADEKTTAKKMLDTSLGDRALTYKEILNEPDKFRGTTVTWLEKNKDGKVVSVKKDAVDFAIELRERIKRVNKDKEKEAVKLFESMSPDNSIRISPKGEITNLSGVVDQKNQWADEFASTMLGKIFKVRDVRNLSLAPRTEVFNPTLTSSNRVLAKIINSEENKHLMTPDRQVLLLNGRHHIVNDEGHLRPIEKLDEYRLVGRHGAIGRLHMSMAGNEAYKPTSGNKVLDKLNIGMEGQPHLLDWAKSAFKKHTDPTWSGNAIYAFSKDSDVTEKKIESLRSTFALASLRSNQKDIPEDILDSIVTKEEIEQAINEAVDLNSQAKIINAVYKKTTYALDETNAIKLASNMQGESKKIADIATLSNDDLIEEILKRHGDGRVNYHNTELNKIILNMTNNPRKADNLLILKDDPVPYYENNQGDKLFEQLRVELTKESLLLHGKENGYKKIRSLIDEIFKDEPTRGNLNRLSDWAVLQKDTGLNDTGIAKSSNYMDLLELPQRMNRLFERGKAGEDYYEEMVQNLHAMRKNHVSELGGDYGTILKNSNIVEETPQAEFIHVKKNIGLLDTIKNLNDATKVKAYGAQFIAGRNNIEDVTTNTIAPYFFLERLSSALSPIALSLGAKDKGSAMDLAKAMVLKRGLPIVGAMTGYDYVSDMFGVATGQNLTATMLSGVANMDLAARGITDALGISEFLDEEKKLNPFYRYWTGDEFMSQEERADWYQNGYQEMRKGRWWSFGGIQEFRGSQVQYYQPNYLRRATSNWKDESLYNNVWDKWSHSWIPTPTNIISPLIYMADPYWLEERFKEERPYPLTGKMFTEETPWGPILNATIGEIIKPQKKMHQDRLQGGMIDSKVLIEAENQSILERAKNQDESHLIRFKDGAIESMTYTNLDSPTPSSRIVSMYGDQVYSPSEYGEYQGVINAKDISGNSPLLGGDFGGSWGAGTGGNLGFSVVEDLSLREKVSIDASQGGNLFSSIANAIISNTALDNLAGINDEIYQRARINAQMSALAMPEGNGVLNTESIYKAGASFGSSVLQSGEALSELKGLSSGDDFLGEMAYTMRFAAGIYGYGAFAMFPGVAGTKVSEASDMTSPVRGFWDANLGGIGGGYFEIFRRFIPAMNNRQESFNSLLNTMPDWMPEKFRFGDPYTELPKGEMRMPGKGYESIHELHPDQYGDYGAFDRMKILADIAPTSHEYKVWRDIADRTVADDHLRQEMEEIKARVKKQGKAFEFFDYGFLGRSVETEKAYIDEVVGKDTFKIVGSNEIYRLAGIEVTASKEDFDLSQILVAGSEVRMTIDKDPYRTRNDDRDGSISAAISLNKEDVSDLLLEQGVAQERDDRSAASMGKYTDFQIMRGKAYEAVSHLPVVYLSQKFFKIRDPLESWKHEMTYGTSYATWSAPIDTFLKPAMERAMMSDGEILFGSTMALANNWVQNNVKSNAAMKLSQGAFMLSNRGAFIGGFASIVQDGWSKNANKYMNIGAAAQVAGWAYTRQDSMLEATIGSGLIGAVVGSKLGDVGKLKGAKYGALAGFAVSSLNANILTDGLSKEYIPERTKEKWDNQEYFDRLHYVKYSGLFDEAAEMAKKKEGVDIEKIVASYDEAQEKNHELRKNLEEAKSIVKQVYASTDSRGKLLAQDIDEKLKLIDDQEFAISVGEYGKSALMYKQLMDSTIFGLKDDASWAELVRAVPQNERTHFIEFFKERDPKKQKEILEYVSPYTAKVLKIAWGQEADEVESNESYFKGNYMPGPMWSGWRPDVDLKDVQIKTIQNEGMLLADFGYFESQLRDADVINAPAINPGGGNVGGALGAYTNLKATLEGLGLTGVNVSVSPTTKTGVEVIANVANQLFSAPQAIEGTIKRFFDF